MGLVREVDTVIVLDDDSGRPEPKDNATNE
jgi:hypothetical protein